MASIKELAKGLNLFFKQVCPAFLEGSVKVGQEYPYLTYTLSQEDWFTDGLIQVKIWTKSTSISQVCDLTDALEKLVDNGTVIELNDGFCSLYKGSPYSQLTETEDLNIKSMYINLIIQNFQF